MTIYTSTGTAANLNPEMGETAQVYAKWINAQGGIAGHPLKVNACNDQGAETGATTCAREAVSDHDVAVVGSYSNAAQEVVPILQQGKVAWFGPISAATPAEETSPVSFPAYPILVTALGSVGFAYANGCKKVSVAATSTAAGFFPAFEGAAKVYGHKLNQTVTIPNAAGDYSPQVAQVLSGGTDCVVMAIGAAQYASFLPAWGQSGTKAVLYSSGGQLSPASTPSGFQKVVNGSYNLSTIPDISVAALSQYRAALATYKAPKGYNYDSATGVGDWTSYVLFTNIVKSMSGAITNQTFLAAANKATSVSSGGILPPINFSKPWTSGPASFLRSFGCGMTVQRLENGAFVSANNGDWYNANNLLAGKGKLGPGVPVTSSALSCEP
jgi:ABC-type branched-subunit amino acid transport system substrate-binding protein